MTALLEVDAILEALVERLAPRVADQVAQRIEAGRGTKPDVRLMPPEEVASIYGLSLAALYKQAKRGTIPCVKLGGLLRFRSDQIEAHLQSLDRSDSRVATLARKAREGVDGGRRNG